MWTKIGKNYISPVIEAEVAMDCLSSAVNHVLHEGQLLLRISSIQIKDLNSHVTVKPIVQRVLNLKNNPPVDDSEEDSADGDHGSTFSEDYNPRQATNENPELRRILKKINVQRETLERLDTAGHQVVASFNHAMQHMDGEVKLLKNEMAQVTCDLSVNSTNTRSLTDDILSTKIEIEEIKRALQPLAAHSHTEQEALSVTNAVAEGNTSLRVEFSGTWEKCQQRLILLESGLKNAQRDLQGFQALLEDVQTAAKAASSTSGPNNKEIIALQAELENLRQELALERSYKSSSTNPVFASRELDILTSSITKIGHRASQVETLQMEFELLKGRVQRMEAPSLTWQRDSTTDLQRQEPRHSQSINPKHKASPGFSAEDSNRPNIPSSTVSNVKDNHISWSGSPTAYQSAVSSLPSATAHSDAARISVPKLTKSGAVDKRTIKKSISKRMGTIRKAKR
ncbi:hypothetical protein E0Z10_g2802 [Xylaria hypoxylon]|uniref:Uncharacterized protein n=1 Tax=Xylaria hypoxylon TaxID=37992 RepID=A0A4Z0Z148_9PEZI|nr:hypothetical protein E0Z10_g2802 [Xylaria hypoxylon]